MSFLVSYRTRFIARPLSRGIISWQVHVGPPDPISHIRPVIYPRPNHKDDDLQAAKRHPYSLHEFTGETVTYQWRLQNQDIDDFSHTFWLDVRTTDLCFRSHRYTSHFPVQHPFRKRQARRLEQPTTRRLTTGPRISFIRLLQQMVITGIKATERLHK